MAEGASTISEKSAASARADVVSLRPSTSGPAGEADGARDQGFDLFEDLSQRLVTSHEMLERKVAELSGELSSLEKERREAQVEKEKIANRLDNLINFLPGGVIVLDSTGRVTEANPVAVDLLGEPLEGMPWREVIARSFKPRSDDGHEVSLQDGRRIRIATRNLGVDGQIILLTDLTETRRLQSELSRHERLSALGKMMSALAHQIRTPLSTAMLYAGHLRNSELDESRRGEFTDKLSSRLNHIERQIQDMLLFVKGELPLNDYVTVEDLQNGLAEALEVPLNTSASHCQWLNSCAHVHLRCNREALIGALQNLANNSIQAVGKGAELLINFKHEVVQGQHWLAIHLTDKGPGIDPELLPRVRDLFVTTKSQGTGLGLAVVQAVSRAHGGAFDLRSEVGQGTSATVLLPLTQPLPWS
ncbi:MULTISPECIES: ATP-binding protein [unclassified Marinimicrobium]|uniref:sensor histidine kinase n=2 Tax=Marinimicrobium TaxID=359337 RepID=UPI000C57C61D|nr:MULTISPECIES: ATP-binding protein [unclassified Marinimicrobium]MAN52397.1 PAS domain-containing sensor histidine kinase [Marinimicrobium sp.]